MYKLRSRFLHRWCWLRWFLGNGTTKLTWTSEVVVVSRLFFSCPVRSSWYRRSLEASVKHSRWAGANDSQRDPGPEKVQEKRTWCCLVSINVLRGIEKKKNGVVRGIWTPLGLAYSCQKKKKLCGPVEFRTRDHSIRSRAPSADTYKNLKFFCFFLVRIESSVAHTCRDYHCMCVQQSLKFSQWVSIFTAWKPKKTENPLFIFWLGPSSEAKYSFF